VHPVFVKVFPEKERHEAGGIGYGTREDWSQERVSVLEMPGHFRGRSYNESHIHDQGTAKNDNDCIT
jgi:hypothetical protein